MSPNEPTSWIFSKETSRCACPYFAFDSWVPDQWKISTIIGCMRNTTTFSVPPSPWRQESLTDHNALVPDFSVSPPGHHQEPTVTPCFPWWSSHHLFLGVWLLAACTLLFFLTLLEERKSGNKKKKTTQSENYIPEWFLKHKGWEITTIKLTLSEVFSEQACRGWNGTRTCVFPWCLSDSGLYQTGWRQCSWGLTLVKTPLHHPGYAWQPAKAGTRPDLAGPSAPWPWLTWSTDVEQGTLPLTLTTHPLPHKCCLPKPKAWSNSCSWSCLWWLVSSCQSLVYGYKAALQASWLGCCSHTQFSSLNRFPGLSLLSVLLWISMAFLVLMF